jgi:hypothetical protein
MLHVDAHYRNHFLLKNTQEPGAALAMLGWSPMFTDIPDI